MGLGRLEIEEVFGARRLDGIKNSHLRAPLSQHGASYGVNQTRCRARTGVFPGSSSPTRAGDI
jgi:hypothetical protein